MRSQLVILDSQTGEECNSARALDGQMKMAAKRYFWDGNIDNSDGLTLLFAHCIGARESLLYQQLSCAHMAQTKNNGNL